MPREKGEEWKHVTVLSNGNSHNSVKMKCVYCDKSIPSILKAVATRLSLSSEKNVFRENSR